MNTRIEKAVLQRLIVQLEDPPKFIRTSYYLKTALTTSGLITFVGIYIAAAMEAIHPTFGVFIGAAAGFTIGLAGMYADHATTWSVLHRYLQIERLKGRLSDLD